MTKLFSLTFDERTKQILVALLDRAISETSAGIAGGDYSEALLQQHDELSQVKRGILFTQPTETEVEETPEEETPEEMYKSQEGRQS